MKNNKYLLYRLLMLLFILIGVVACSDDKETIDYTDNSAFPPPVVTITSKTSLDEVEFRKSQTVTGTIESNNGLRDIYVTLMKQTDNGYEEINRNLRVYNPLDNFPRELDFSIDITVSQRQTAAIGVFATDIYTKVATQQVIVTSLVGVPEGKATIFDNIEMAPEWESPDNPTQPYIFSFGGVTVGGKVKHVLSLSDVANSTEGSIDFAFANFWRNQTFGLISNRGVGFASADRIGSGTVGRQVDDPWLSGATKNAVFFKIISADLVTSLGLNNFFETTTGDWETYELLDKLNSYVTGTATGDKQLLQRIGASSDNSTTPALQIVDGTYIAIRRQISSTSKYGIIKVVDAVDDTPTLNSSNKILGVTTGLGVSSYYKGPDLAGFDYTGVTKLYGQKCKLKIIIQE